MKNFFNYDKVNCIKSFFLTQYICRKGDNMEQVSNIISTKDLAYIEDMLNWNYTLAKVANHYSGEIQDSEIADEVRKVKELHVGHFNELMSILGGGINE